MPEESPKIRLAVVHRPNDSGVDLPAGRAADELEEDDYRAIEMPDPTPKGDEGERPQGT